MMGALTGAHWVQNDRLTGFLLMAHIYAPLAIMSFVVRPKKRLLPTLDRRSVYQFEALLLGYIIEPAGIHEAQTGARNSLPRQRRLAKVFSD